MPARNSVKKPVPHASWQFHLIHTALQRGAFSQNNQKPFKRFLGNFPLNTGLKPGVNETEEYPTLHRTFAMSILDWFRRVTKAGSRVAEDEEDQVDPYNPFPDPITIEITDVIDLHTIPPRDVKRVVEEYLREAHAKGFRTVRIIHGKGIGVQREIVRNVLAKTLFVDDWTDAPLDAGGLGATIVRFGKEAPPRLV